MTRYRLTFTAVADGEVFDLPVGAVIVGSDKVRDGSNLPVYPVALFVYYAEPVDPV